MNGKVPNDKVNLKGVTLESSVLSRNITEITPTIKTCGRRNNFYLHRIPELWGRR
jgi:hypothetical protein